MNKGHYDEVSKRYYQLVTLEQLWRTEPLENWLEESSIPRNPPGLYVEMQGMPADIVANGDRWMGYLVQQGKAGEQRVYISGQNFPETGLPLPLLFGTQADLPIRVRGSYFNNEQIYNTPETLRGKPNLEIKVHQLSRGPISVLCE